MGRYNPDIHHRRSIRLQGYDYSQKGAYFITICTKDNAGLFGEITDGIMVMNEWGKIAQRLWYTLPQRFPNVELDQFVVMPNHIHGILFLLQSEQVASQTPSDTMSTLDAYRTDPRRWQKLNEMMRTFKAVTSYTIRRKGLSAFAWKQSFFDRIIRNEEELEFTRLYIANNPRKWLDDKLHPSMFKPDLSNG